jgi:hypothetical protein
MIPAEQTNITPPPDHSTCTTQLINAHNRAAHRINTERQQRRQRMKRRLKNIAKRLDTYIRKVVLRAPEGDVREAEYARVVEQRDQFLRMSEGMKA